jgi:hypothetical protein
MEGEWLSWLSPEQQESTIHVKIRVQYPRQCEGPEAGMSSECLSTEKPIVQVAEAKKAFQ